MVFLSESVPVAATAGRFIDCGSEGVRGEPGLDGAAEADRRVSCRDDGAFGWPLRTVAEVRESGASFRARPMDGALTSAVSRTAAVASSAGGGIGS